MPAHDPTPPADFTFLLLEDFSNLCLANAVEPLRAATAPGAPGYAWRLVSLDGAPVASSSGIEVAVDGALADVAASDAFVVIASYGFRRFDTAALRAALARAARRARLVGAMDTGPWLLAAAGLLDARRATIHWQEREAFAEAFPEVAVESDRYVADGARITCGGATAVLDLMLWLIRRRSGDVVALDVMRLFIYDAERPAGAGQQPAPSAPFVARAPQVAAAILAMEAAIEEPLGLAEVARRSGCSQRTLQRSFERALGVTPQAYYQHLRLSAARALLGQDARDVAEAAARTGFASAASFARAYRRQFGEAPSRTRAARLDGAVPPGMSDDARRDRASTG